MMQNHILLVELNRNYYCFDDSKVKEKKLRFSRGLTEYIPSICQLVKYHDSFTEMERLFVYFQPGNLPGRRGGC